MEPNTCPKREYYSDVFIDIAVGDARRVAPGLLDEVARHIRTCEQCWAELDAYLRTAQELIPVPDDVVARIAANVKRRVLERVASLLAQRRRPRRRLSPPSRYPRRPRRRQ